MNERQIQGTGLVLLSLLAAILVAGLAWRVLVLVPGWGETVAGSSGRGKDVSENSGPIGEVFVPAGWRAEQVADALESASLGNGVRFMELVADTEQAKVVLGADWPNLSSLEGYLFPGVYDIASGLSEERLIGNMMARFRPQFPRAMRQRAEELGLSLHEVVTLASIVERESSLYSESPVIAGVFLNRLRGGIPLQADPTVVYAIDSATEVGAETSLYWQRQLSSLDLQFESPYNTYLHKGLPPGPIASPSPQAIEAVLYPAEVEYLYFVAKGDGAHAFARTLPEHQRNVELYRLGEGRDGSVGSQASTPGSELQRLVEEVMEPLEGHVGVVVKNLVTGEAAYVNPEDYFTTASLYKLFVMDAAFDLRERGQISFDDHVAISEEAAAKDTPAVQDRLGATPAIANAIENMIVVSSNAAGVALLDRLGRQEVTAIVRNQGLRNTWLSEAGLISTPEDVAHLLESIAGGRAVSQGASADMLAILLRQEINDRLPKYLPDGTPIAHKTGSLDRLRHDAGILYASSGPIVIVVMSEGVKYPARAAESIARLGRLVLEYFDSYRPAVETMADKGNPACPANPFRPEAPGVLSDKTIVLDPGKGGADIGASFSLQDGLSVIEKGVTLDVALRLKDLLTREGATVYMTRCRDVFMPIMARAAFANTLAADMFVSIHLDGSDEPDEDGTQLYYFSRDGNILANYLLGFFALPGLWDTLSASLPLPNGGVRQQDFDVQEFDAFIFSRGPSALTKSVYLTNPSEASALREAEGKDASRRQEIAQGHLVGILNYFEYFDDTD